MTASPQRAKRRYLIIPMALFAIIFAAYSAVWVFGSRIMDSEVDKFIEGERAAGRTITYEKRKIVGYPFALRTKIDGFVWDAPGEWTWSGERLYVLTLPYDVTRIILAPRNSQKITYAGQTYEIDGIINVGLKENAYSADANGVTVTDGRRSFGLGKFVGNWDLDEDGGWTLKTSARQFIYTDAGKETAEIPYFNLSSQSGGPYNNRFVINGADMAITDGTTGAPTQVRVAGDVAINGFGQLEGDLTVGVRNEDSMLNLAQRYDALGASQVAQVKGYMAGATVNGTQDAEFPLRFQDGNVSLQTVVGPVVLGEIGAIF